MKGKLKQFGRCMRHKDVTSCAVGATGFYLLYRFHFSREMDDGNRPDFRNNEEWFDIKILTDGTKERNKVSIQKKTYTSELKTIMHILRIVASHFGHWGRVSAPVELEFKEVAADLICILGKFVVCCFVNWLIVD